MSKSTTTLILEESETLASDNQGCGDSSSREDGSNNLSEIRTLSSNSKTPSEGTKGDGEGRKKPLHSVTWDESAVDNEMLNKKKSKRCCIYHKKRAFGESSSSSSEDQEDESEDDSGDKCEHARHLSKQ